jgi:UDP-N-acetylglucosamine/UDP-N-acetylgalactosamine diphosphorylase
MNKSSSKQELINILKPFEQEHLVKFWDELDETQKEQFADDLKQTDFAELNAYFKQVSSSKDQTVKEIDSLMKPVPNELKGSYSKSSQEQLSAYEANGLKAIAEGQVAVLLLAGGQGTRLGVKYPKGMYSVDLQSGKSLYHLQAERLIRIKQLAKQRFPSKIQSKQTESSIPLYIMTSEHTQESTINYFNKHDYFGLDKENVFFFEQFMLPCLTNQGKVILDKKHKLSKAPDGNGGLYKALLKEKS